VEQRLLVPDHLQRNNTNVLAHGVEETGAVLINLAQQRLGLKGLDDTDVLDIGCGVRFTQTLINRDIPIKSYTGVDVDRSVIQFLREHVHDTRFRFAHWNVLNPMYTGKRRLLGGPARLTPRSRLPVRGSLDVVWLFSVFTHLDPSDADAMFAILRRAVRPTGALFFSAFLDHDTDTFREGDPEQPRLLCFYNDAYFRDLIERNGWTISAAYPPQEFIAHHFVCRQRHP
jgi:SAM-dependent methyltransferase